MDELLTLAIPKDIENLQLPDPSLLNEYRFRENRQLWLDREIADDAIDIVKDIMLFNMEDDDRGIAAEERLPIVLYIFSPGGDLDVTNAIIGAIRASVTPVYTVNMGIAMSGGLYILLAGHKRFAMPWSCSLIHNGSGGSGGSYDQAQSMNKQWQFEIQRLNDYVMERTSIDKKLMNKKKATEWYVNGAEQVELGIVEKIVDTLDEVM